MLFLALLCLVAAKPAWALDLYQGETAVADQSADARVAALGRTLLDVAVKVSGDANAANNGTIIAAASSPEKYMQRYEYRQELVRVDGKPAIKLYLRGSFYAPSMSQLLARAGLGAWGRERPTVAVYVFDGDAPLDAEIRSAMQDRSSRRGVNVRFPGGVAASELSEETALRLGSAGQNALLGRIGGTLWLSDGRSVEALNSSALDGLSDRLASALVRRAAAISNAPPEEILTEVTGLRSGADYGRILKYLAALSGVKKLTVLGAQNATLRLRLNVQGGGARLAQSVGAGQTLRVLSESPAVLEIIN